MSKSIGLFGDTGSGKTTLAGEYAKHIFKLKGKKTLLAAADSGGYESLLPLIELGVIIVNELGDKDPWAWVSDVTQGRFGDDVVVDDLGLIIYDSGTFICESLLKSCADLAAGGMDIGGRKAPKMRVTRENGEELRIGTNVDSHYLAVQSFIRPAIWDSTRLPHEIIWTFTVDRGETETSTPILGPKLAGKALTTAVPKWFNYFFRLISEPGGEHRLYLKEHTELGGMGMSFGNSRYPLDAVSELPEFIEPASLVGAMEVIGRGKEEAIEHLRSELNLKGGEE